MEMLINISHHLSCLEYCNRFLTGLPFSSLLSAQSILRYSRQNDSVETWVRSCHSSAQNLLAASHLTQSESQNPPCVLQGPHDWVASLASLLSPLSLVYSNQLHWPPCTLASPNFRLILLATSSSWKLLCHLSPWLTPSHSFLKNHLLHKPSLVTLPKIIASYPQYFLSPFSALYFPFSTYHGLIFIQLLICSLSLSPTGT